MHSDRFLTRRTRWSLGLACVFVFSVNGCCCPMPIWTGQNANKPWFPFTSVEGNFRTSFPTEPTHTTSDDGLEHRYTSQIRRGLLLFRASYELNADLQTTPKERLELTTKTMAAENVTIETLDLQGHPGAEATYTTRDEGTVVRLRHRVYQVGDTSYQVMAVMANGERADAEANRFFQSFQLINPVID